MAIIYAKDHHITPVILINIIHGWMSISGQNSTLLNDMDYISSISFLIMSLLDEYAGRESWPRLESIKTNISARSFVQGS
jgi:hypothetical protein